MNIEIRVPTKAQIVSKGCDVIVAPRGTSWSYHQLGDFAKRRGVYIHHANRTIHYVGNTTRGQFGTFGERLRREFHESSAGSNRRLYEYLSAISAQLRTCFLDLTDIDLMVESTAQLSPESKALILEQALIGVYDPPGNLN